MKNKNLSGAVPLTVLLVVLVIISAFDLWITPEEANLRLQNLVIGTVPVIGLAVGMLILRHARVKNGQSANQLFWIFLSIDCVLIVFGVIKLVMRLSGAS